MNVEGYAGTEEQLDDIVISGEPFYCHQGTRKVVEYRHPSGMTIPGHPADFDWRFAEKDGERFPIKSDGSAQNLCAGWCQRRIKYLSQSKEVPR